MFQDESLFSIRKSNLGAEAECSFKNILRISAANVLRMFLDINH